MPEPVLVVARSGLLSDIQIPLPERTYTSSSVQCQTLPLPLILATEGFLQTKLKKKKKKYPHSSPCSVQRKERRPQDGTGQTFRELLKGW